MTKDTSFDPATAEQIETLTRLIAERGTKGLAIVNSLGIRGMVRVGGGLNQAYVTNVTEWILKFHPVV